MGETFPASKVQEQFYVAQQAVGDSTAYHAPLFLEVRSPHDEEALRRAVLALADRHEALRTRFRAGPEGLLQVVDDEPAVEWAVVDHDDAEGRRRAMAEQAARPFDLEAGPLFRAGLLRAPDADPVLMLCFHHIVCDGWSLRVLVEELAALLEGADLDPDPYQYADYALWHNEWLAGPAGQAKIGYWTRTLAGDLPVLRLPDGTGEGVVLRRPLSREAVDRLRELATAHRTTAPTALLTAYLVVLAEYAGTRDVVVGVPAANRGRAEFERTVGCFANMIAVRADLSGAATFDDALRVVRAAALGAQDHQEVPFEVVVGAVNPPRLPGLTPIFQAGFSTEEPGAEKVTGLVPVEAEVDATKYRLQLHVDLDAPAVTIECLAGDPAWAREFARRYDEVLTRAAADPSAEVFTHVAAAPSTAPEAEERGYTGPRDEVEEALVRLWREVVGREPIGIDDNFFALGGDSMRIVQLVARAAEEGLRFRVRDVLRHQTVRELAQKTTLATAPRPVLEPFALIDPADRAALPASAVNAYPVTALQAGMLYHTELAGETAVYREQVSMRLRVPAHSEAAWRAAVAALTDRHDALRTSFAVAGFGAPLQIVHDRLPEPPVTFGDVPDTTLDRERAPLARFHLQRLGDTEVRLSTVVHHAIVDGWSQQVLLTDLFTLYLAELGGPPPTPPPRARYDAYVALESAAARDPEQAAFWAAELDGLTVTTVPALPAQDDTRPSMRIWDLPGELSDGLTVLAEKLQVSVRMLLLAAHLRVLAALSGGDDVVTGVVYNGRVPEPDGDRVIGLFLNTLPFRLTLGEESWAGLVAEVTRKDLAIQPNRRFPVTAPLFDVYFNYTHFHNEKDAPTGDVEILDSESAEPTNFLMGVEFNTDAVTGRIGMGLRYDALRIPEPDVTRFHGYYRAALEALVAAPDARHADAELRGPAEIRAVEDWNRTATPYPGPHVLHRIIEQRAAATPDAVAVRFRDTSLTYAETDARANRLAHRLAGLGARPGDRVGVRMPRSADLVVALLAVLKAGCAYVPIDVADPEARVAALAEEAGLRFVLTEAADDPALPGTPPATDPGPGDPAYLIFTSGSTGRPKGVVVSHGAICNRLRWMQQEFALTPGDRILQKTPATFDVSVWEFFWPLMEGATLVVAEPEGHRDPGYLTEVVNREKVTVVHFVPSMLRAFLDASGPRRCPGLRLVVCSGEALTRPLVRDFHAQSAAVLANLYGPTEAAVDVTSWRCAPGEEGPVPIGRPIANVGVHLLDRRGREVPVGVPGELHISGAGLAEGYHGRPDLTAERFVTHRLGRLYRTGDLARHRPDGAIDYLGRLDDQVKIRGMRVEPGEIEAVLAGHPDVAGAAVVLDGERLVAYHTGRAATGELRDHCARLLPGHMVPSVFMELAELPLTTSGKIARGRLPAPRDERPVRPPRTPTERRLATLWAEVLDTEVSADRAFFDLGGHSLSALRLAGLITRDLGRPVTVADLLAHDTVERLAAHLDGRPAGSAGVAVVTLREGTGVPLWLVHPVGGSVFGYRPLVDALPGDFPVYGLAQLAPPAADLERMADDYVRALPGGHVRLAGWSFGGVLAYEMARRLGHRVTSLCMIDSGYPRGDFDGDVAEVMAADDTGGDPALYAANLTAHHRYRPGRYAGEVRLALSREADAAGWAARVDGPFRAKVFDADHYELMRPPVVAEVAALLT
ncbi:non-ribosomal peptide synthetase [Herbidospora cretacea]|uniref:non-ribosomal peptide synthetase n=1 Tax=Herbidospora cretacea TaxID=28444 RepID=UPI0007734448|nr:non-ribosomal peptide synthetase [Herbidospora cretacea]